MSNHPKPIPPGQRSAPSAPKRRKTGEVFIVLAVVLLAGLGIWRWKTQQSDAPTPPAAPVETTSASAPSAEADTTDVAAVARPDFEKLVANWIRPDGGYILQFKSVDAEGTIDAGYFNPRPINVAKAVASMDGGALKVVVELRDVKYPGSTYTLTYDASTDQLRGNYFQAVEQSNFEVFFQRWKPGAGN
ncbi:MAG TPA: hypothetical protein PKA41_09660 [Verrucomicrobiota bacterium]|nr:hypothetical protein [Verrucomicrobiota bacterium]